MYIQADLKTKEQALGKCSRLQAASPASSPMMPF